jgi:hypothetical protein
MEQSLDGVAEFCSTFLLATDVSTVQNRREICYAAAVLLLMGEEMGLAIDAINRITPELNEQGTLYSTQDTAALLCLLQAMDKSGLIKGGTVEVDGESLDTTGLTSPYIVNSSVSVPEDSSPVLLQVNRLKIHDWNGFASNIPVEVSLMQGDSHASQLRILDDVNLKVTLPNGGKIGYEVIVNLPDGLSYVAGGEQLKEIRIDTLGKDELCIPLTVTADCEGTQHFFAMVVDMTDEHSLGNPGPIAVQFAASEKVKQHVTETESEEEQIRAT